MASSIHELLHEKPPAEGRGRDSVREGNTAPAHAASQLLSFDEIRERAHEYSKKIGPRFKFFIRAPLRLLVFVNHGEIVRIIHLPKRAGRASGRSKNSRRMRTCSCGARIPRYSPCTCDDFLSHSHRGDELQDIDSGEELR